jgi:hypothetical protein
MRVAALQSPFVFKVTASLGDDSSNSDATVSTAAAAPPPHSGLGVASTPVPSNHSSSSSNSSSDGAVAAVHIPKGAVLEVPEGVDQDLFMEAVESADDVKRIYPDRIISITQGMWHTLTSLEPLFDTVDNSKVLVAWAADILFVAVAIELGVL